MDRQECLSYHSRMPAPRYKWYVVGMLWWICFFNYADRQAIFSVFPLLEKEFGLTLEQLGWLGSSFGPDAGKPLTEIPGVVPGLREASSGERARRIL